MFVVATPIGNLSDLSNRATEVLRSVGACYAEDTRRTGRLLKAIGSTVPLRSLHAHNEQARTAEGMARLAGGMKLALVSDGGTPAVSDPGARLVEAVLEAGGRVSPVPGPSAVSAALSAAGMPGRSFFFAGFSPRKGPSKRRWINDVRASRHTVVLFESPWRTGRLLADLAEAGLSDRRAVFCRELTKLHEEVMRSSVGELAAGFAESRPRGEVTLVLEGCGEGVSAREVDAVDTDIADRAEQLAGAGFSRRDAAARLAEEFGLKRNQAYKAAEAGGGV